MTAAWITLAALGGIVLLVVTGRLIRELGPIFGAEKLPTTPLQRLAQVGLSIVVVVGIGLGVLVAIEGPTGVFDNDTTRRVFGGLILAGIVVWGGASLRTYRQNGTVVVDERDRNILQRATSLESGLALLSLTAWMVILTEVFWADQSVPLGYLQLLFWSTFLAAVLGKSLGIVIGYRRIEHG